MPENDAWQPVELKRLKEHFGNEIELVEENGQSVNYRIMAEFQLNGLAYAGLQTPLMRKDDEIAFFRVIESESGELSLESIGDEEEWENVSEGYDSLLFDKGNTL